jgi:hypothetical protein
MCPLGLFLSGGIDSPLIASKMCALNMRPVRACGRAYFSGASTPNAGGCCGWLWIATWDPSLFPTMMASRLARQHVTGCVVRRRRRRIVLGYSKRLCSILRRAVDFRKPILRAIRGGIEKFYCTGEADSYVRWRSIGAWVQDKAHKNARRWAGIYLSGSRILAGGFPAFSVRGMGKGSDCPVVLDGMNSSVI